MKFSVTYCVADQQAGSNPLWHSCLLLSQLSELGEKMEVVDQWGFYGVPTTGSRDSLIGKLKIKLGLDLDLQGNHGMLRHEELRFLDLGRGLHGVTFELTEDQFNLLREKCSNMALGQENAIKEIVEPLGLKGKSSAETRVYPHEQYSALIFALEKARAIQEGRAPRLKPFELKASLTFWGPDLNQSNTCKSQAIALLAEVLSPQQINRLTENGKHITIPRYSGVMESIFLHSSGPLRIHKKSSGKNVYYRDMSDPGVKLHWTLPPQEVEVLSADTKDLLTIPKQYCAQVKSLVKQLQLLEWLFINAELPARYDHYKQGLIERIHETYEAFAKITPKKAQSTIDGWLGKALLLLSAPRNIDEACLQKKIAQANNLLNAIYMAIVDDWAIDDGLPSELQEPANEAEDYNWLEAIASYLTTEEKQQVCNLIGRNYLNPELDNESENPSYAALIQA
ncbi:hypothetical protein [Legionella cardiaca]|uniref:Uncharacterized protein n=1 Tax=Legionella cardiaca TaxID=1071983 RepID=A0ABY8AU07_9GAMM|nr:hypothetical protein [Legionella cardiaca]WED42861.1 hypothetical protein PXX05_13300 [Legionella cardiaca]